MKFKKLFFLIIPLITSTVYAQCTPVRTPNGTPVPVTPMYTEGELDYNCHYYAFFKSEGYENNPNYKCVIEHDVNSNNGNTGAVRLYLDGPDGDNSYVRIPEINKNYADKVIYELENAIVNEGGHSADFDPDPNNNGNDWVSKNGPEELRRHSIDDISSAFDSSDRTYFAKCKKFNMDWGDTNIIGPSTITSQTTYTMPGLQKNKKIQSFAISNPNLFSSIERKPIDGFIRLIPKPGANGKCTIIFNIRNGCPIKYIGESISRSITVSSNTCPPIPDIKITGPSSVCLDTPFGVTANPHQSGLQYNWNPQNGQVLFQTTTGNFIQMEQYDLFPYIILTVTNPCGDTKIIEKSFTLGPYCKRKNNKSKNYSPSHSNNEKEIYLYPNPVLSNLRIQGFEAVENVVIYDTKGSEIMKSIENNIDMSSLKPGLYFIKLTSKKKAITTHKVIKK